MDNNDINLNNIKNFKNIKSSEKVQLEKADNLKADNLKDTEKINSTNSLNDTIQPLKTIIEQLKLSIEKWIDYQSKIDEEVKGKDAISRGEIKTKKYINYYDRSFIIPVATASDPNDFDSSVYAGNSTTTFGAGAAVGRVEIFTELERYSDTIYVANDGTNTLFAVISHGGKTSFSKEEPIYPGEVKCFHWVYEMRFRSPTINLPYRVSEYCLEKINIGTGSISSGFIPIELSVLHNQAQPAANTDILAANLTPTNTPTNFRIEIAMSNAGIFSATIINGGNTQVISFNEGVALVAGAVYIFDILVHNGDTINFRYSVTGGIIQILRVQELDAATA